ncbi:MAG: TerC family protein [Gemmatimonadaceae bacterium]|jgi:tellurite resistance protein TerC|nr:TerC family protein [Gemmatimonadaceae bacterium]
MTASWGWIAFNAFVLAMLALDLGVFNRHPHRVSVREAGLWSLLWASLAAVFALGVRQVLGAQAALEFTAGYLVELALSVDNLFVFLLIFGYFRIPAELQHRLLFWGIIGALVMRGTMILFGALLLARFHWITYLFGAFLVYTGIRMAFAPEEPLEPEANPVIRLVRRLIPVSSTPHGGRFFVREPLAPGQSPRWVATPFFIVLVLIETTDLVFAVDSIPAVFGVTQNAFIVYTSNVFAILGLRSLFFLLSGVMDRFHLLKYGLAAVLAFVGTKMLIASMIKIPIGVSLGVVAGVLAVSVAASLVFPKREDAPTPADDAPAPVLTEDATAPR